MFQPRRDVGGAKAWRRSDGASKSASPEFQAVEQSDELAARSVLNGPCVFFAADIFKFLYWRSCIFISNSHISSSNSSFGYIPCDHLTRIWRFLLSIDHVEAPLHQLSSEGAEPGHTAAHGDSFASLRLSVAAAAINRCRCAVSPKEAACALRRQWRGHTAAFHPIARAFPKIHTFETRFKSLPIITFSEREGYILQVQYRAFARQLR